MHASPPSCAAPAWQLRPLLESDVPAVLAMEGLACLHPAHAWSQGNYRSSLQSDYWARVCARPGEAGIVGVCVAMSGVEEMHLLNIAVDRTVQRQGLARLLLQALYVQAEREGAHRLWLEVRASNEPAQQLYRQEGFTQVSVRKGYYPATVEGALREDALVMQRPMRRTGSGDGLV